MAHNTQFMMKTVEGLDILRYYYSKRIGLYMWPINCRHHNVSIIFELRSPITPEREKKTQQFPNNESSHETKVIDNPWHLYSFRIICHQTRIRHGVWSRTIPCPYARPGHYIMWCCKGPPQRARFMYWFRTLNVVEWREGKKEHNKKSVHLSSVRPFENEHSKPSF